MPVLININQIKFKKWFTDFYIYIFYPIFCCLPHISTKHTWLLDHNNVIFPIKGPPMSNFGRVLNRRSTVTSPSTFYIFIHNVWRAVCCLLLLNAQCTLKINTELYKSQFTFPLNNQCFRFSKVKKSKQYESINQKSRQRNQTCLSSLQFSSWPERGGVVEEEDHHYLVAGNI